MTIELTAEEQEKVAYAMRRFTYESGVVERTVAEIVGDRLRAVWVDLEERVEGLDLLIEQIAQVMHEQGLSSRQN